MRMQLPALFSCKAKLKAVQSRCNDCIGLHLLALSCIDELQGVSICVVVVEIAVDS